ncbi:MAG TPA: DeoR/GlpR family DNA-binding transcription regulator [Chthonomonadales bacterium]|nr:DeoR/GlpR family DNA-binding transcription regulator [Chthonomonadales bacterium]
MGETERVRQRALFAEERRLSIYDRVQSEGKVAVENLVDAFGVSAATVRQDLARLEEQGLVQRTHGGAILRSTTLFEPTYAARQVIRLEEKRAIAAAAATEVREGDTLLLDAGTTTHELALALRRMSALTVVTNSLANALVLMENPNVEVLLLGGAVHAGRRATLGPLAIQCLEEVRVDRAFLAFNGVDATQGFTVVDFEAAAVKRQMLARAREAVVLCDSSKVGRVAFAFAAPLTAARLLVTDRGITHAARRELEEQGLPVRVAA